MIAVLDAAYGSDRAAAACVYADSVDAAHERESLTQRFANAAPYEPGAFYKRELPLLLDVLRRRPDPALVLIDGYVWLGPETAPGLGAHLFEALQRKTPVIGIAKTAFRETVAALEVLRGASARPLFVTSAGIACAQAADLVRRMHGDTRLPTLVRRADALARDALRAG